MINFIFQSFIQNIIIQHFSFLFLIQVKVDSVMKLKKVFLIYISSIVNFTLKHDYLGYFKVRC